MKKKLYILKIGGSVATVKSATTDKIRRALLLRTFEEIKKVLARNTSLQLIIVHGAGSFGHTLAHRYALREGTYAHKDGKKGSVETRMAIQRLHAEVLQLAVEAGLLAASVHTGTFFRRAGKKLHYNREVVMHLLQEGYTPLLYGDMIGDSALGMSICSGDAIVTELGHTLRAEKLFFASDVKGMYTSDPYVDKKATLIPHLSLSHGSTPHITLSGSHHLDVTGGLKGKLAECKKIFKKSRVEEIHIFNGLEYKNYGRVLRGELFPHTVIDRAS